MPKNTKLTPSAEIMRPQVGPLSKQEPQGKLVGERLMWLLSSVFVVVLVVLVVLVVVVVVVVVVGRDKTGAPCNIQGFVLFCEACNLS